MTTIRFTRGSGLAGAIVRIGTWSDFAHVGFKLDDGSVLDATPEFGVSVRMATDTDDTEYWKILAPKAHIEGMVAWGLTQVGKPYDWSAIYGFAVHRDWHNDAHWFCSEYVQGCSDAVHWPFVRDADLLDRITPRDLRLSTRIAPILKHASV